MNENLYCEVNVNKDIYDKYSHQKERFKGAKFSISVFKTIEEIDTKVLTDADVILYTDEYTVTVLNSKTRKWKQTEKYNDFFIVRKKEGQSHIRYCDVIDVMIENEFTRTGDHRYMESIGECYERRNTNSIPVYGSFWGS
jgi:hypothetical protein